MQEAKLIRGQRTTAHEIAFTGLFAALIAVGAFIKINIPVQPFPMHFTLQFFFVLLAGYVKEPDGERPVCACTWQWDWLGYPYLRQEEGRLI